MNVVSAAEGKAAEFEEAFRTRESHLAEVDGFLGFELLRREGENEYLVSSRWESREAFHAWLRSDAFRKAHSGDAGSRGQLSHGNEVRSYEVLLTEAPA
ncbi:antibiotic biosynthesis monooxygenase [Conexibacter sp. JD483]|uniref:antibiotic biosynthesis monooxygenase family protein n=1 Tax=unclassified Conexibacter TaxID=2627773 RepID=UPI002722384C|nr:MULTISPECIES: antibiotic biosynthesis monooxygenase [unclassified Conexibacter]MDO8185430.1 antibiotic biosynthesis monooxygenase [Conexibacter sp. CPCC 205706]MDO8198394.1 antibiotic biosynthesis monooxygenase [Conexibacter sp. CPCC 205762]MDR9369356.1 antibiotic biosynthesis monooxygenase [Conexibacter sp. JD483]